jgi:hypothetical protein
MRVESQRSSFPAVLMSDRGHAPHNLLMANVDTIEIADGDRAGTEIIRQFGQASEDPHADSPT